MKRSPKLPAGGYFPPYGHVGHWEVTGKLAEEMGFSAPAADVLCDAAQDPDFYEFGVEAAHAQTPDAADFCAADVAKRATIVDRAVDEYAKWLDERFGRCVSALDAGDARIALYWLGYALHGIEDLAVHAGMTNGEHASAPVSPDYQAVDVALSSVYARRLLDAARNALGQDNFDRLRNHDGEGRLSFVEKRRKQVHPKGWDIDNCLDSYKKAGRMYTTIDPKPKPVRWDRECVLAKVLEGVHGRRASRLVERRLAAEPQAKDPQSENPQRRFEVLTPLAPLDAPAEWTVLVYMAGDDRNPGGIEYAISQDLAEIKEAGSTDAVHFLVQTDDASGNASFRYRLRRETPLNADRLERFNGDLNTGSTKTLVDFVRWAHRLFPAKRTALVLWGHGSGHDDQNVYRAARGGEMRPRTAARLAQRRLGFFSGTRRSMLEQGPTRGYGYDDTAGDFLDNTELRSVLLQIKAILGGKLDLLGFDACLMAMVEVAYQVRESTRLLVASERTEPGDGWWYREAFGALPKKPSMSPKELARAIVGTYRDAYRDELTLSAVDCEKVPPLAQKITSWTKAADPATFHALLRSALDCSPRAGEGYCDLGSLLEVAATAGQSGAREAEAAREALNRAVIASCGRASGLTIYAPGNFTPMQAGSTDALYLGLDFVRETGWGSFLRRVYPAPEKTPPPRIETLPPPSPATGLDRFNASRVLAAVRSNADEVWIDRLRSQVLTGCDDRVDSLVEILDQSDAPRKAITSAARRSGEASPERARRILILPGIMGSLLHDRSGNLGAVWIDPWNLIFGDDFEKLRLAWESDGGRIPDADTAVRIEAYSVVPVIYDRMALALMNAFGPIVEFAPYDWRQPIDLLGTGLLTRLEALAGRNPGIQVAVVAHSMGGLVAADAFAKLAARKSPALAAIKAHVVLGTPFLGSTRALQVLRAEKGEVNLLKLLPFATRGEIVNIVQTFRGLSDMLPCDREPLRQPALYAPGPLSRLQPGDARLGPPPSLVRDLPPEVAQNTLDLICTTVETPDEIALREDGSVDYSRTVGGDGTVPKRSAVNGEKLLARSRAVDQAHMTLPLDGKAIDHAVGWIGGRFGVAREKEARKPWPAVPELRLPGSREELMRRLENENELSLGDLVAMLGLL
jgi:pimeloyl-ACP methyl ester carboxylesterase